MLICPKCKNKLEKVEQHYECEQHHCFDIAKRGYVNLLLGNHKASGDDKDMIKARTNFLSHGYYDALRTQIMQVLKELNPNIIVDAGCGEGFYTNRMIEEIPTASIYGFDLSKSGVDEACKAHNGICYGVANVFHLPLDEQCTDVLCSIFAPFDWDEIHRVLNDGGSFIKVGPGRNHLMDLKKILYQDVYENKELSDIDDRFKLSSEYHLEYKIHIQNADDIWALFQMTPYYWKSPKEGSERLKTQTCIDTTVSFHVEVYQKEATTM